MITWQDLVQQHKNSTVVVSADINNKGIVTIYFNEAINWPLNILKEWILADNNERILATDTTNTTDKHLRPALFNVTDFMKMTSNDQNDILNKVYD